MKNKSESPKRPLDVLIVTAVRDEYNAVLKVDSGALNGKGWVKSETSTGREISFRTYELRNISKAAAVGTLIFY